MPTWTVISTVGAFHDHIGAVAGRVDVFGHNVHTAVVGAPTADEAIGQVRDAFRTVGGPERVSPDTTTPYPADRWTVVGTASNGVCASATAVAVIVGDHKVQGDRNSMLSHRWTEVVDAPTAAEAKLAGQNAADDRYDASWE